MEPTKGRLIKLPSRLTRVESAHRSCASAKTSIRPEKIVHHLNQPTALTTWNHHETV